MANDKTRGNLTGGLILIGLGLLFLGGQLLGGGFWRLSWPILVLFPGVLFLLGTVTGGRSASGLAIPGSIITTVGLILLYQNTFNAWQSWAYAWPLIPAAVGVGLIIHGTRSGDHEARKVGTYMAGIGLAVFMVFGAFFAPFLGTRIYARYLWPLLLIGLGLYILLGRAGFRPERRVEQDNTPAQPPEQNLDNGK